MLTIIRVVDFETTGIPGNEAPGEPPHAPCEIGWCDIFSEVYELPAQPKWFVQRRLGCLGSRLLDPGRPIGAEAMAVHHIRQQDVNERMPWRNGVGELARETFDILAAHNAAFERSFWPFEDRPWICTYRCALRIWPDAPRHSNQVLRYWLDFDFWCESTGFDRRFTQPAHRAGPDAYVTAWLLKAMLVEHTVERLVAWSAEPALLPRVTFGKHANCLWRDVPRDYLEWVLRQDFDEDTKFTAEHWWKRSHPLFAGTTAQ